MEEQLIQTEQFMKSHMALRNMLRFFLEQNVDCVMRYFVNILVIHCILLLMYNMSLLKATGMTPTSKNFTIATAFIRNEQHLYFSSAASIGNEEDGKWFNACDR
ncbi:hypothetical protein M9H77_01801 [Catharanthus roseus]|uniref:Uncharacterized protein n=1 Tax=Catharanthus roseus TaxID=4058 RepID=A0ACC0C6R1_CATRO|nr:hypothetical protein M9H77_01801 [Catharanthus roseus]